MTRVHLQMGRLRPRGRRDPAGSRASSEELGALTLIPTCLYSMLLVGGRLSPVHGRHSGWSVAHTDANRMGYGGGTLGPRLTSVICPRADKRQILIHCL